MKYDKVKEAVKNGEAGELLTFNIKKWDESGDFIIGKVVKIEDFQGSKFETICKSYLFDTDQGLISTILGASSDKQLESMDLTNHILYVEYLGQIDLEGGKRCNRFKIVDVTKKYNAIQIKKKDNIDGF
jgi:hypothetical protein